MLSLLSLLRICLEEDIVPKLSIYIHIQLPREASPLERNKGEHLPGCLLTYFPVKCRHSNA